MGTEQPSASVSDADRELRAAFERRALIKTEFRHREHLRLAYIYLALYPFEEAYRELRQGLQRLLAHLGADPAAYHETMTRAWLMAVRHFMEAHPGCGSSEEFLAACPRLLEKEIMLTHYTRERLFSPEARAGFIPPDVEPIPPTAV